MTQGVPRVLFNLERVGGIGSQPDDVLSLKDCDTGVRELADELGWREELETEWRRLVGDEEAERQLSGEGKRAADLQDEVSRLADGVKEVLHLTDRAKKDEAGSAAPAPAAAPVRAQEKSSGDEEKAEARHLEADDAKKEVSHVDQEPREPASNCGSGDILVAMRWHSSQSGSPREEIQESAPEAKAEGPKDEPSPKEKVDL